MGTAETSRWSLESDPDALLDHPCLQPDRIADTNMYLSSAFTEGAVEVLKRHGITHILQVGFELQAHHPGAFSYCSIQIADRFESDIVQCLPQAFAFIAHGIQDGRVLVHCLHGQSRSAAVVIAFLMWRSGQTYNRCFEAVRACRSRVQPNRGFEVQLRLLEQLGFDFRQWPGWSEETYTAACQQGLLGESSCCGQQLLSDAQQQKLACVGLPSLLLPEQQHLQQRQVLPLPQQHQLSDQLLGQRQQQQQPHVQVGDGAVFDDVGQQDVFVVASPLPLPPGASLDAPSACGKGMPPRDRKVSGRSVRSLQLSVDVECLQQQQQHQHQQQQHSKHDSGASDTPSSQRHASQCCTVM